MELPTTAGSTFPAAPASLEAEQIGDLFEAEWQAENSFGQIDRYLPTDDPSACRVVLVELAARDLALRLIHDQPARVEEYLARYRELRDDAGAILELLRTEYEQRRVREPRLSAEEYRERFPALADRLAGLLDGKPAVPGYTILGELGRGGMSVVYKARHTSMKRLVAIKVISKALLNHPQAVERFRLEGVAAAQLDHSNVVRAYDAFQVGDLQVLVMEFVDGLDLAKVVERDGPLPVPRACDYARQAALGLQHALERGLVHRDVKPQNLILVPNEGLVKILDLGLTRFPGERDPKEGLTGTGVFMGTPAYIAPEQALDARTADIRADVYSLGCTLYCLLAGRPPFQEETEQMTILAHHSKEAKPLHAARQDVPRELSDVVARMMAKEPGRRFQTPKEVAQALAPFCEGEAREKSQPGTGDGTRRPPRRVWSAAAAALLFAVLGVALWIVTDNGTVEIRLSDPAAKVEIRVVDGETIHLASHGQRLKLRVRDYELLVTGEGFETHARKFSLKRGENPALDIELVPEAVAVEIQLPSLNTKLAVMIDGQPVDAAALNAPLQLRVGKHKLLVRAEGYEPFSKEFTVMRGQVEPLPVELKLLNRGIGVVKHQTMVAHPEGWITMVAFTPNGGVLVTASDSSYKILKGGTNYNYQGNDNSVRFWRLADGKETYSITNWLGRGQDGHWPIQGVALSPVRSDSTLIAISSCRPVASYCAPTVTVWSPSLRKKLHHFPLLSRTYGNNNRDEPGVWAPWFSADGKALFAFRGDTSVHVLDLQTGKETSQFRLDESAGVHAVVAFCMTADRQYAFGAGGRKIRMWSMTDGQLVKEFSGHARLVTNVSLSRDGKHLVSSSVDGTAWVWDIETGQEKGRVPHGSRVHAAVFAGSADRVITAGEDGLAVLWDVPAKQPLLRFEGHTEAVTCLTVSADGRTLATGSKDKTARTWSLTGEPGKNN